ncbi:alpha-glucan phosphorylase, H isozyme [Trifolium repens]|nr:alpha-glucan phosphorylase, H isozyme [Trifolium repens]
MRCPLEYLSVLVLLLYSTCLIYLLIPLKFGGGIVTMNRDIYRAILDKLVFSISNEFVPDSTSIASSIKYHAEFTTSFSPEKFETRRLRIMYHIYLFDKNPSCNMVVFVPDYNVSVAEMLIRGSELS